MNKKEEAIFGVFDGVSSSLGVILAMAINGSGALVVAAVALAIGASVSMGLGEWLSDNSESFMRAFVMGSATFIGAISPAIPFIFLEREIVTYILCGIIVTAICIIIAKIRPGGWPKSLVTTFGTTFVATGLAVGGSLIAGAV